MILLVAAAAVPAVAHAGDSADPAMSFQNNQSGRRDSLWNGVLIGAAAGVVAGMLIAPPAFCGSHDSECATIVRVAVGLPAIAGGIGIGALVDGLNSRDDRLGSPAGPRRRGAGVAVTWKF
jgi:hypothetical protein